MPQIAFDAPTAPPLVRLLGAAEIRNAPLPAPPVPLTPRLRDLLALLAAEPDVPQSRETLAEALWPGADIERARTCLRAALARLRRIWPETAGPLFKAGTDGLVSLAAAAASRIDAVGFERATERSAETWAEADRIGSALRLYRGDFAAGSYVDNVLFARERLRERYVASCARLGRYREAEGDPSAALEYYRAVLREDPLREAVHQRVLAVLIGLGRRSEAVAQYRQLTERLNAELGLPPLAETEAIYRTALDGPAPTMRTRTGTGAEALRATLTDLRDLIDRSRRLERRIERQIECLT